MKRKYTEKIHAERLIKMMEMKNPCTRCPAAERFDGNSSPIAMWRLDSLLFSLNDSCIVCYTFVETNGCPCTHLGQKEAIKRSRIALEEKGYIVKGGRIMNQTEKKIAEMLKENTGRHMLDSGGAYGRHWERNQDKTFEDEPATILNFEEEHIKITHNLCTIG